MTISGSDQELWRRWEELTRETTSWRDEIIAERSILGNELSAAQVLERQLDPVAEQLNAALQAIAAQTPSPGEDINSPRLVTARAVMALLQARSASQAAAEAAQTGAPEAGGLTYLAWVKATTALDEAVACIALLRQR